MFSTLQAALFSLSLSLSLFGQSLEPITYVREPVVAYAESNSEMGNISNSNEMYVKLLIIEYFPQEEWENAKKVFWCESKYKNIQSEAFYPEDVPKWGVKKGDRELSFNVTQIHIPSHPHLDEYRIKTDVEYAIKSAYHIWEKAGWSAWKNCSERMGVV